MLRFRGVITRKHGASDEDYGSFTIRIDLAFTRVVTKMQYAEILCNLLNHKYHNRYSTTV